MSKEDQKKNIIGAGIKLFLKNGYAGTSVSQIATKAGLSKGGLYWHFKSKEEIVNGILDRYYDEYIQVITKKTIDCTGDFVTNFKAFYDFTSEFARDNRELLMAFNILLIEFAGTSSMLAIRMNRLSDSYTLIIQNLLEEGIRTGKVDKKVDPLIHSRIIASTLIGSLIRWYVRNWGQDDDRGYDRRHAIIQRNALLKIVLAENSSETGNAS